MTEASKILTTQANLLFDAGHMKREMFMEIHRQWQDSERQLQEADRQLPSKKHTAKVNVKIDEKAKAFNLENKFSNLNVDESSAGVDFATAEPKLPPIMVKYASNLKDKVAEISLKFKDDIRIKK
ncbi:hypothetical protein CEXT_329471 [Caerostris extrusa]|uniref:Uncharacterized protein n=1 Tax=Caerostris extrusa TaxID=172846 RepID=A0AAV4SXY4_CAEEX|nr:hypothetical protein CEXT_329471 [Caerostris extrusa]